MNFVTILIWKCIIFEKNSVMEFLVGTHGTQGIIQSNKVCVRNKTGFLNLSVFNVITWTNESETLPKHENKYKL